MSDINSKELIFSNIQKFLANPPVVIWGSGATIPFGFPSMDNLNEKIKEKIPNFNPDNKNLEIELDKEEYKDKLPKIKSIIWESVNNSETKTKQKFINEQVKGFSSIEMLIKKLYSPHPQMVNLVTTNYDLVLEHVLSFYDIPFTDGFSGRDYSKFDASRFAKERKIVKIIKVHGSLNWFQIEGNVRLVNGVNKEIAPAIIVPGKNKYREAYHTPFRDLIQISDNVINRASSILAIGFGFNDEHLTPKVKEKINSGTPLVLITKNITNNCKKEISGAQSYILIEKGSKGNETNIYFKIKSSTEPKEIKIKGDYWKLDEFLEVF